MENEVTLQNIIKGKTEITQEKKEEPIWKIKIPTINLEADIEEGTDVNILNSYVGHFQNTDLKER